MTSIDLNADLGEGMGTDEDLLGIVSSASIACGGIQDTAVSEGSTHPHLRAPEVGALTPCLVILPRSFLPRAFKRFARSFQRCLDRGDVTLKLPLHPPAHDGQRQPQRPAELDTQELTSELRRSPTTRREMRAPGCDSLRSHMPRIGTPTPRPARPPKRTSSRGQSG